MSCNKLDIGTIHACSGYYNGSSNVWKRPLVSNTVLWWLT